MNTIQIQTAQNVFIEYQPAGVGERILAQLIDYVVKVAYWLLLVLGLIENISFSSNIEAIVGIVFVGLPLLLYTPVSEIFMDGQTLGKRAMNIKVVKLDGGQPTAGDYLLRWLLCVIDANLFFFFGIVGIITIASSQKSQRIGDMAANTTVISLKRRSSLAHIQMPTLDTNYQPEFPQVARLSDADVDIIRQTLQTYQRNRQDTYLLSSLRAKLETLLDIQSFKSHLELLETLLRDHAHITSQE